MNKCDFYELYFFDHIDGILSKEKDEIYKNHIKVCNFCTIRLNSHLNYKKNIDAYESTCKVPEEMTSRLFNKIKKAKTEQKRDSLLEKIGLIPVRDIIEIFELDEFEETKLIEDDLVIRIKNEFYVKKEDLRILLIEIFGKFGNEKKDHLDGLFDIDGLETSLINDYLHANFNKGF